MITKRGFYVLIKCACTEETVFVKCYICKLFVEKKDNKRTVGVDIMQPKIKLKLLMCKITNMQMLYCIYDD